MQLYLSFPSFVFPSPIFLHFIFFPFILHLPLLLFLSSHSSCEFIFSVSLFRPFTCVHFPLLCSSLSSLTEFRSRGRCTFGFPGAELANVSEMDECRKREGWECEGKEKGRKQGGRVRLSWRERGGGDGGRMWAGILGVVGGLGCWGSGLTFTLFLSLSLSLLLLPLSFPLLPPPHSCCVRPSFLLSRHSFYSFYTYSLLILLFTFRLYRSSSSITSSSRFTTLPRP